MEQGILRAEILNELSRSAHGKLHEYGAIIGPACAQDPAFIAHLIAWDCINGQIKDSKLALPVLSLASREFPDELAENSIAHLAMQSPRELLRAFRFSVEIGTTARRQRAIDGMIRRYLWTKEREPGKWNRLAIRHRRTLKSLYAVSHCPMPQWASDILFGNRYQPGSIFADVAGLSRMEPGQIAAVIQKWHLSPLVVSGAMAGAKAKQENSAVVQSSMLQMSDTEIITRAKSLERKGLSRDAALKETFRSKVSKATKSNKATLKTGVAAEEVEDDGLKTMLRELQERQIESQKTAGKGIDGDWLIIVDKSQSQDIAIELGAHVAAAIAKFVTGKVRVVFCDACATGIDATGATLEMLKSHVKYVKASGPTSYGVGLQWARVNRFTYDGIVLIGDGGENSAPAFTAELQIARDATKKDLPVYFYQTHCDPRYANTIGGDPRQFDMRMSAAGMPYTTFDLRHGQVDYYSIPNLVQQMNVNRFSLVDRIMACPLVTLDQILGEQKKELAHAG